MAANTLPSGIHDLFFIAERMHAGLERHGRWIRIDHADAFAEILTTARETENAYAIARARKALAGQRFATADEALTAWLAKARLVVMLALGAAWSERWIEAGFTHRGTNVPKHFAGRTELARRLTAFFAAHAEFAAPFADVTPKKGREIYEQCRDAEAQARSAKAEADEAKKRRDAAEKILRRQMWGTGRMLHSALGKSDPRWQEFGLNQPKPDAPARQRLAPHANGMAATVIVPVARPDFAAQAAAAEPLLAIA